MNNNEIYAFIDEFGSPTLSSNSDSYLYICVAIIIKGNDLPTARELLNELKKNTFSDGNMKSNKVGSNHQRRKDILEFLNKIPFKYYALIINKSNINPDSGMKYKKSAYKRISRMLYENLSKDFSSIRIVKDNFGTELFRDSFNNYLNKHNICQEDMFNPCSHEFIDSKTEIFVQLADLVAGSLAYTYDEQRKSDFSDDFNKLLQKHQEYLSIWPPTLNNNADTSNEENKEIDEYLEPALYDNAINYVCKYDGDADEKKALPAAALRILLDIAENSDSPFIDTSHLADLLKQNGFDIKHKEDNKIRRYMRTYVTSPLRDKGIIITGQDKGIKVALNLDDINKYVERNKSQIIPRIDRLQIARNVVKEASNNFDFLENKNFTIMQKITDAYVMTDNEIKASDSSKTEELNNEIHGSKIGTNKINYE